MHDRAEGLQKGTLTSTNVECPDFSYRDKKEESGHEASEHYCGIWRWYENPRTGEVSMVNQPCRSRNCSKCRPEVLAAKMDGNEHLILYGVIIDNRDWQGLQRKLARKRSLGMDAEYLRIPISASTSMVVSTYEVGHYIDTEMVYEYLEKSETAYGNISMSRGWQQPDKPEPKPESEWQPVGIVTADHGELERLIPQLDVSVSRRPGVVKVSGPGRHRLRNEAQVVSDADFWEMLRTRAGLSNRGDDWFGAFLARLRHASDS